MVSSDPSSKGLTTCLCTCALCSSILNILQAQRFGFVRCGRCPVAESSSFCSSPIARRGQGPAIMTSPYLLWVCAQCRRYHQGENRYHRARSEDGFLLDSGVEMDVEMEEDQSGRTTCDVHTFYVTCPSRPVQGLAPVRSRS